jgi:hypothetical protein
MNRPTTEGRVSSDQSPRVFIDLCEPGAWETLEGLLIQDPPAPPENNAGKMPARPGRAAA